ncbi:MAG: hypothetical protein NW223_22375 [Hyphomicrobiaceae bacterium]|nr:hypothetical protein [Hyphomicrobiaceae bacterium]
MPHDRAAASRAEEGSHAAGLAGACAVAGGACLLLLPALWNGFPLLQWDTGGYLARWYEGHLVENRSTVYGLLLFALQTPSFWPCVVAQSALATWIVALLLKTYGLTRPAHLMTAMGLLATLTALPWLSSMLLTDILAGLAVVAFYLITLEAAPLGRLQRGGLAATIALAAASHSATMLLVLGLTIAMVAPALAIPGQVRRRGLALAAGATAAGAMLLLACNLAVSGRLAWTPGGASVLFARMLEDGIVRRYLEEHCSDPRLRLCRYRRELPATADAFLWGGGENSIFNRLGRFEGLEDEMRTIAMDSLVLYPGEQIKAAATATLRQLVAVGFGEGTVAYLPHTHGIIERFTPRWAPQMRAARQQNGGLDKLPAINALHVPIALGSALALGAVLLQAARRKRLDPATQLAAVVILALIGNAAICGMLSNPHPRYGARLAWLAPLALIVMALRRRSARGEA